ncbi:MAG TPA: NAD-dependent succinate-semialdehyde dehydrogenase [Balneolales bacterium]|nr:NAD-dependent succinate-semialdehyde dehydrogenase [Balneolales bacterium]
MATTNLISINPSTGKKIKEYDEMSAAEVDSVLRDVAESQKEWQETAMNERSKILRKVAARLRDESGYFAEIMGREMGKPLSQGAAEAEKCAWVCEYYAENAENMLQDVPVSTDARESYVHYEPLGTVFAIMPWNYPFWQVFRFAAPALMAGNAGVLKHAENVTGCAVAIENLFKEAGLHGNLFRSLLVSRDLAKHVIEHPLVAAVTLTGSTKAGKIVAAQAGAVLKKTVLELGGSDPYVVLKDANLKKTVETCVTSRMLNSGQSCIAAKRFIVVDDIHDDFVNGVVDLMRDKKMGAYDEDGVDLGPQAREDLRANLHRQVRESIDKGAKLLLGGNPGTSNGFFYPATVLSHVTKGMPAFDEETFGPVAAIVRAKDEEEAIALANDTSYGLGSAVFTEDLERGRYIAAHRLKSGASFVNDFVKSDPRLPFGGIKNSGYGRELSPFGIREFLNTKTVYVA